MRSDGLSKPADRSSQRQAALGRTTAIADLSHAVQNPVLLTSVLNRPLLCTYKSGIRQEAKPVFLIDSYLFMNACELRWH